MHETSGAVALRRLNVFWASSALRLEPVLLKCTQYIRGAIFLFIINIPSIAMVANSTFWAVHAIFVQTIFPLVRCNIFDRKIRARAFSQAVQTIFQLVRSNISDRKIRARAFDQAVQTILMVLVATALFRRGSPLQTSVLDVLIYPPSSYLRMLQSLYGVVVPLALWMPLRKFLIRTYMMVRRFARLVLYCLTFFIEDLLCTGLNLFQRHRFRLLWLVSVGLWDLATYFIYDFILKGLLRFIGLPIWWSSNMSVYGPAVFQLLFVRLPQLRDGNFPKTPIRIIVDAILDTEPKFEYDKLEGDRHIRLLILHRRKSTDSINCTLFEVSLDRAPTYEAISYTWSDSKEMLKIRVNGGQLEIPKNAHRILESRKSLWKPRLLWIDSVCINQRDVPEKTRQIKLMGDIYGKAFVVSVCLQPPENPNNEAAGPLEPLLASHILDELLWTDLWVSNGLSVWLQYAPQCRKPRWRAFQNLVRNRWFDRVWVIQEVALAKSVRILYGKVEIPWQHLIEVMSLCYKHTAIASLLETTTDPLKRQLAPTSLTNAQLMAYFRRQINEENVTDDKVIDGRSPSLSFSSVLYASHHFAAKDPRDKVFGIQGFCTVDGGGGLISPNYEKTVADTYKDAADYILAKESPYRLLSYAGIGYFSEPSKIDGVLPSWCPDWSRRPRVLILSYNNPETDYCAGGEEDTASKYPETKSSSLMVRGQLVDTIVLLGEKFVRGDEDACGDWSVNDGVANLYKSAENSYRLLREFDYKGGPYPYTSPPQLLHDAYWRTLIGDRTDTTRPAPAKLGKEFDTWRRFMAEVVPRFLSNPNQPVPADILARYGAPPEFSSLVATRALGRKLCITSRGYIGLVPPFAEVGDAVFLIRGAQVPFVLRIVEGPLSSEGSRVLCHLVGEAYVHGLMYGDVVGLGGEGLETQVLEIA